LVGLGLSVALAACGGKKTGDDDDDNAGSSSGGSTASGGSGGAGGTGTSGGAGGRVGTGATGGNGGSGATGGTTASGGSSGSSTAGHGGSGGSGGGAGSGAQVITGGPFPFPLNRKPTNTACTLTTVANASATVQTIYNQWKTIYLVSGSPGLRVQRPENSNDTVSEGIGYGMLASVYMGDKATFDGLWQYAQAHFDAYGLMNWKITPSGTTASDGMGSATDADEDMAWSLIMASGQWPTGTYLADAKKILLAMRTNELSSDGLLKPGDGWGSTNKTYPDYFSPAYFRVFKLVTNDHVWDTAITRNYQVIANVSGDDGLVPDSTTSTYDTSGQAYKYDACRTPWRIGMDYCFNSEPQAKTYLDKIGTFFNTQGVSNIGDGYSLTGSKTSNFPNMAFIGPAGVAGMAGYPKLLDDAFTFGATGNGGTSGYFQQTLRVITMLVMSGNFVDYTQP
jgi:endo-1,4-beta-D-glucanase Y